MAGFHPFRKEITMAIKPALTYYSKLQHNAKERTKICLKYGTCNQRAFEKILPIIKK